ncbi:MAG: arsenic efflux protein [Deltaproteobacteria bacterium]|nr:arsenic efflux protein [Deltaproteobacteria bacterium]
MSVIIETFKQALMITSFVFVMMLIIEYLNVQTKGSWQNSLQKSKWMQYILSAFLGATPGCLGAFTVVALYAHDIVSFGALVTVMIATSGDEAYVMLSMFPGKTFLLTLILFLIGIATGFVTDILFKPGSLIVKKIGRELEIHGEDECVCFPKGVILRQLKDFTTQRGLLIIALALFIAGLTFNQLGPPQWNWIKITFLLGSLLSLFIVSTVPEHFLEKHLWEHIVKAHVPRVFLWTFGALLLMYFLIDYLDLETWIKANYLIVLLIACLIGLIPESGPHMIFVTLFAQGSIPFGILLASSVVQDGHGMLPLLAESKRSFVSVKIVNFTVGLIAGLVFYLAGIWQ